MPKAHAQRSHRSAPRSRRHRLPFYHVSILLVLAAILFVLWLANLKQAQTYNVMGQPSISADFINSVLNYYHSPAHGKGKALYNYGVKYGIDPVYALAFFMHESSFGTSGVATVTHSLGNIRATTGYRDFEGYRYYRTWEAGFEDWYRLILYQYVLQWNLTTVDQIVPVYAPASDNNDVQAYISAVKTAVDTWRAGIVQV